ncbi:MAG: fibronectin type III domain-containing protein, partial [Candidatus Saccharimonadales bacterium]
MSKVKARVGGQWQTLSGAAQSTVPPGAPTGVSGDSPSAGKIHLSWAAPVNTGHGTITNYVLIATKVSDSAVTSVTLGNVLNGDITGLVNGAAYTCAVKARNSAGDSPASASTGSITVSSATVLERLVVSTDNTRYFAEAGTGNIPFLSGSHTWQNLVDSGNGNPPPVFDYTAYLDFLTARNHNFFRLWRWEQTRWSNETADDAYWFSGTPWKRTGPGNALDGLPKFDLSQFDQTYFDRLRARVVAGGQRGMYVAIMLFNGWSVGFKGSFNLNQPWNGHPFNANNNINSINGDTNADGDGYETQDLSVPAITTLQEAYVQKVADTVGDLSNVLYEIGNECDGS